MFDMIDSPQPNGLMRNSHSEVHSIESSGIKHHKKVLKTKKKTYVSCFLLWNSFRVQLYEKKILGFLEHLHTLTFVLRSVLHVILFQYSKIVCSTRLAYKGYEATVYHTNSSGASPQYTSFLFVCNPTTLCSQNINLIYVY